MNQEIQNVEHKRIWKDEYLKWVSGFANAQGGKIYIGIDDDLTVVGVDNLHKQLEDIPNKIINNTGVFPETNHIMVDGKDVIYPHFENCKQMKTTDDFFIPDNEVKLPEELDYSRVDEYIRSAEAFSRSTYQSVYIIDYFKQNFLYVSPNPMFLCGLTPEQMMKLGYRFYLEYVPEDEQQFLIDLNEAGFSFYQTIPVNERKDWYISYDFHILNGGKKILVNHKLTPLVSTSDGRIWLALCVVSASTHTSPGHIEMHRVGSPDYFEYNRNTRRWDNRQMPTLTDGEKAVLTLSIQGYTMSEIADRICLSPDTIKKYRQRIFEKLDVRNISEAIVAATNNKLL